jgi:signal transduction histidine kinase
VLVVPVEYAGMRLGTLAVGGRTGEKRLGRADRRLLEAVLPLVAAVWRAEQATGDERARLRRELHDGLGPSLTGVGLGLEALASRSPDGDELVARLRVEVASALAETRRIIEDLRPAALEAEDLVGALRRRADGLRDAVGLDVELVVTDGLPVLAPELESAAYRIADEALTNVVRHAEAHHCTVTVAHDAGRLRLSVADDGVGFPGPRNGGVGLGSMRERAERLGGFFEVGRQRVGTLVVAELPTGAGS